MSPARIRRRVGCLGCLGRLVLGVALGVVLIVVMDGVFTPWAFYFGGTFRPLPVWQGIAKVHASSGDYVVYFWMSPAKSGPPFYNPYFNGWGALCTPRGERYPLRVIASLFERPGRDTNGREMRLEMYRRPWYWSWTGTWDRRPSLTLRGRWQNPDLVMTDKGSLSDAFLPDGRLYDGPPKNQPHKGETLTFVFHEVPWTTWFADCRGR